MIRPGLASNHGLVVVKPSGRPSTWTMFHERQINDLQQQLRDANQNALAVMEWIRSLHFSRQRWRLAAAVGWGLLGMLLVLGKR